MDKRRCRPVTTASATNDPDAGPGAPGSSRIAPRLASSTRNPQLVIAIVAAAVVAAWSVVGIAQTVPSPDQLVAALKQNLAESQKRLRQYEWIETTAISLKGEEKSRKQQRVYYGADGTLTKTPLAAPPAPQPPPQQSGRRGGRLKQRIVENKKDDMREYLERAVALMHRYVPPDASRVEKAKESGRMQITPVQPGAVRAAFTDFVQQSDAMTIDVDTGALLLSALTVSTYLDKPDDAVTLDVRFATLADGTGYASRTTLEARDKHILVVLENSGHRPLAR